MDRRTFNKLFAGTVTAAGISKVSRAEAAAPPQGQREAGSGGPAKLWQTSVVPPNGGSNSWEFIVLDSVPSHLTELDGTAAADIDGDGKTELVISGNGALVWYRPSTAEKGVVALGHFAVGVALEDVDGDGHKEVICGRQGTGGNEHWVLSWYKFGKNLHDPWSVHILDPEAKGYPHDVVFGDLDGDGKRELVAIGTHAGLYAYKIPPNPKKIWKKQTVQEGHSAEGTATGDLNGDGKEEIVSGPYWYSAPQAGAFSGQPWKMYSLAPGFRELCRTAIIDVNGDGHLDVVLVEDEYPDGRLAWYENRLHVDPENPWRKHSIDAPFNFAHSLRAWHDPATNEVRVFVGEMNEGGWAAPYNWEARLLEYTALNGGWSWHSKLLYQGEGTHEAVRVNLDGSGKYVIFGHSCQVIAKTTPFTGWVQMFRPVERVSPLAQYKHVFIDRDKPYTGIEIKAVDVDGDGCPDIACGAWWYKNPTWERHTIPGIGQIVNVYDLDRDGKNELICIKARPGAKGFYAALTTDLVWLRPIDPITGKWEEHTIGTGDGDWPHGSTIGPFLPGGRLALVCGYHHHTNHPPQIFEVPEDPKQVPWKKRVIADIPYGEELAAYDLDGDGKLDIVAGPYWLENLGNGQFKSHLLVDPEYLNSAEIEMHGISRVTVADVNGDGRPDILFTVEDVNYKTKKAWWAPVGWMENTGDPRNKRFKVHIIDRVRSPHSLAIGDLEGNGETVVVVGEHDPFKPYRSDARVYAYKKTDPKGLIWSRYPIDNRFSNHVGTKVVQLTPGKLSIISQSWMESAYVHLWERGKI